MHFLRVQNISLYYDKFLALSDLSLEVGSQEIVAVIGANGAGKTSLMKAICALQPLRQGQITLGETRLDQMKMAEVVKAGIGYVPEGRKIFPSLSVEENILLGQQIGRPGPWNLAKIFSLFPELAEKRHLSGTQVSGGQQQMIAIGRALMTNPRLLLCDEISLGLAPLVINRLYALLRELAKEGLAILLVEQAVHKALQISHRYYCMLEGQISLTGHSAEADFETVAAAYFGRAHAGSA